jgi:acyl-CoA reductase-like NAD-dependent aldehyde dehydrogenase
MSIFEYAPAPESRAVVDIKESYGLFVNGEFTSGAGTAFKTVNPATEEVLAEVAEADASDVDRAVKAARKAYDKVWGPMPGRERAKYLYRIARIIQERSRELAVLETLDNGKPIKEARDVDVPTVAAHFFYYAGWADKLEHSGYGTTPLGVAGQVIPWNFPLLMLAWKVAPALACGNTVVLKPAETTPLTALLFAEICQQADLPPGVVNILTGAGETGRAIVAHPGVDKVAFTGSTAAGRAIGAICGEQLKRVSLELGGKSAAIVLEDADLAATVEGLKFLSVMNSGQACVAQTRVLAPRSRYEEVVEALAAGIGGMQVGDPMDPATEIGPMVAQRQQERVAKYIALGQEEGARLVTGGVGMPDGLDRGWYVRPTVFADVDNRMRIAQEEIFGPVVSVIAYDGVEDAVRIANDSDYGLAGTVWTTDVDAGLEVARGVRTGTYGINTYTMDFAAPFGGFKASGLGREFGPEGLGQYTEVKSIYTPPPAG